MAKSNVYYLLTNYVAEICASKLTGRILNAPRFTDLELSTLSTSLGEDVSLVSLHNMVKTNNAVAQLFSKFNQWLKSEKQAVETLRKEGNYFSALMTIEINLIYKQWYRKKFKPVRGESEKDIAKYLRVS